MLIVVQTVVIYILLIGLLRVFGKKELAQLSIIDLVFILLISNSVQNAMVGSSSDFMGGLLSAGALFVANFTFKKLLYRHQKLKKLIEGEPLTLVYKGQIQQKNLQKSQISVSELEAAVREHGVETVAQVDLAVLEIDGNISVLSDDFKRKSSRKPRSHPVVTKQQN